MRKRGTGSMDLPYRIVTKKVGTHPPGIETRSREEEIADHLFPTLPLIDWRFQPQPLSHPDAEEPPMVRDLWQLRPLSLEEFQAASKSLPSGKACGTDGIPNEVLAYVMRHKPSV